MYEELKSLDKRVLWELTKKKLDDKGYNIRSSSVTAIVNIFLDVMNKEIINNKIINIGNFIEFKLVEIPPRRARNYYTGEMGITKPYNRLYVSLSSKLNKILLKKLDMEKYLNEEAAKDES